MRPLFRRLLTSASRPCASSSSRAISRSHQIPWCLLPSASQSTSTERVSSIVNELSGLTLLEVADLTEVLRTKLGVEEMPVMGVMMPGMGFAAPPGGAASANSGGASEEKKEKTTFDLQLESFDAASKIKVIKEVRAVTNLGLKEAKALVEGAPGVLKKGLTKEEAEAIVAKLKEAGAKVALV